MRLVTRDRTFEIVSVLNVNERDKMMQLICEEVADLYEAVIESIFDCTAVIECDAVFCGAA